MCAVRTYVQHCIYWLKVVITSHPLIIFYFLVQKPLLLFLANLDYVGISHTLEFAEGVTEQKLHVIILDDLGKPLMEGAEHFEIFLSLPVKGALGSPEVAIITINDTYSDCKILFYL